MADYSIENIDASQWEDEIDCVFKSAYRIEAELLGVDSLPPLERSKDDLSVCGNAFIGYLSNGELCGVLEIESLNDGTAQVIASLAVAPKRFREGIGKSLVQYVLGNGKTRISVTTGAKNEPAIRLYSDLGLELTRRFRTPDGIAMVEFSTGQYTAL